MTREDIKTVCSKNLADLGATYWTPTDLDDSIQDCYDDIIGMSGAKVKKATITWVAELAYYIFPGHGVTDYLGTLAVFNNNNNRFLCDKTSLRQLEHAREDWEIWRGTPFMWTPAATDRIAIAPNYSTAVGTFDLYYLASAEELTSDSDPIDVANDVMGLFQDYTTADMLEQAEEYIKAQKYWKSYYETLVEYKERCSRLAASDILMRV